MSRYDEKFHSFYNSSEWKLARDIKIAEANGLCQICIKQGKIIKGSVVHHIIPIEEDMSKALDQENLIVLCPTCHNEMHERISPLQEFLKKWEDM